jgi:hypothetical protein
MKRFWLVSSESAQDPAPSMINHVVAADIDGARVLLRPLINKEVTEGRKPSHILETSLTSMDNPSRHDLTSSSRSEEVRVRRRTQYRRYWPADLNL